MPSNLLPPSDDERAFQPHVIRGDLLGIAARMKQERLCKTIGTVIEPVHVLCSRSLAPPNLISTAIRISCDRARKKWSSVRALSRLHNIPFIFTIDGEDAAILYRHPHYHDDVAQSWIAEHNEKTRRIQLAEHSENAASPLADRISVLERRVAVLEKDRPDAC